LSRTAELRRQDSEEARIEQSNDEVSTKASHLDVLDYAVIVVAIFAFVGIILAIIRNN